MELTWGHDADEGPATFEVFGREALSPRPFARIASLTEPYFLHTGLRPVEHEYYVLSIHGTPPQTYRSVNVKGTPLDTAPPPPAGVRIRFSHNLYLMEWSYSSPPRDFAGFRIEQKHTPHGAFTPVTSTLLPPASRSYIGNPPKNRIYLRVVAVDRSGNSTPAAIELEANPGFFKREPHHSPVPTDVVAQGGETIVSLLWAQVSGASRVYRSQTSGTGYVLVGQPGSYAFVDSGLAAGTYFYVVTSVDYNPPEESGYSAEVSATVTDVPPPAPDTLTLELSADDYTLTFAIPEPPPDFVGSNIRRC